MFLTGLSDTQKELVLDLCINASNVNGEFTEQEKNYIRQYAEEMRIPVRYEADHTTDTAVEKIAAISSPAQLRGIGIELIALLYCDDSFDVDERNYMVKVCNAFGIPEIMLDDITEKIGSLFDIYKRLNAIVLGE